ncbi:MAG: hypothetical protein O2960_17600 [Verrucomicrobia bacterium]|nr:hypothetical protein [Verrucomicrobiota bacterium]
MNLPVGLLARLGQSLDELMPVHVTQEDVFTLISTAHDVINRAGIPDSQFTRHAGRIAIIGKQLKGKEGLFYGLTPSMASSSGILSTPPFRRGFGTMTPS